MSEADNELLNYSIHNKYLVTIGDSKFIVDTDSLDKVFDILSKNDGFLSEYFRRFYYRKFNYKKYENELFDNTNKYKLIYDFIVTDLDKDSVIGDEQISEFLQHSYDILEESHAFNFKIERLDKITIVN